MKIYSKEEAIKKSTEYFGGDELAAEVFVSKYALRNENLELKEATPDQMHRRLAKEFARIEKKYPNPISEEEIFNLFDGFRQLIPQGSPMFGIGNLYQTASISNCFVVDVVDSYGGICRADERIAQISKRRGGGGLDISPIRPRGMKTKNSALTTDGIIPFMERFSNTAREVAQHGRRGALMISISVHHPEVLNFIRAKLDLKKITGANISIRISDEFMEAVRKDKVYEQRWPVDSKNPSISQKVNAREIWDEIIKFAWKSGEPGILYWDTMIDRGVADCYADVGFKTLSVNPCGELGLGDAGSCILLIQNLTGYIDNPFTKESKLNKELLIKNTRIAQRLIDDMVDLEIEAVTKIIEKIESDKEPEEVKYNELSLWKKVRETAEKGRRTGLGITGLGDAIAMLNLKYGSDEAIKVVKEMLEIIRNESYRESTVLAKERGVFSVWDWNKEKDNWFISRLPEDVIKEIKKNGRRNIANLTISPAGSVSVVAQTSSGCEPVYLAEYKRKRKLTESDKDTKPDFIDDMGDKWKEYTVTHHGLKKFKEITGKEFKDSPYFGAQAGDIDYKDRIKTQSMLQKYIDHSISSTINLPNNISVKTVDEIYMMAWEEGCKGITVYRDGSRAGVLTKESSKNKTRDCIDCDEAGEILKDLIEKGSRPSQIIISPAPKRPEILKCEIQRSKVGGGDWLFFVGMLDGQPYEVFGGDATEFEIPHKHKEGWVVKNGKNKEGITQYNLILGSLEDPNEKLQFKGIAKHFNNKEYGAFTRVISLSLRHGVPIKYICSQLIKSGCEGDLFSFQRAMSRILKKYIVDGEKLGGECPICKSTDMYYKNGCPTCKVCGNSACM